MAPHKAVTVVLPFDPVIAMTFAGLCANACANNSTSPTTGTEVGGRLDKAMPGLIAIRSISWKHAALNAPVTIWTCGHCTRIFSACGGAARLSAARTCAPWRTSQRTMERPVSPRPNTNIFLPLISIVIFRAHAPQSAQSTRRTPLKVFLCALCGEYSSS